LRQHFLRIIRTLWPWLLLAILVIYIGLKAVELNRLYYSIHGPFYDSVSYLNELARVVTRTHSDGIPAALASVKTSTVFLPWVTASLLCQLLPLTRELGVWIQLIWLFVLVFSLYYYLHYLRKLTPLHAIAACLPFLSLQALFHYNAGLSDFRMDLHLYLLFSITAVWFLATYETDKLHPWIMAGIFAGLTCLARATAPVYLILAFAPLLMIRLCMDSGRRRLAVKAAIAVAIATIISIWFYAVHYDYLRFYYVEWNSDANARLSLVISRLHFWFVASQIGPVAFTCALLLFIYAGFLEWREAKSFARLVRLLDIKLLYIGAAPVMFLVLSGAGLNPFVSMPASFGLLLFLILPVRGKLSSNPKPLFPLILLAAGLAGIFIVISHARENHIQAGEMKNPMQAHQNVMLSLLADAEKRGLKRVRIGVTSSYALTIDAMLNLLIYDFGFKPKGFDVEKKGLIISAHPVAATPVDWKLITKDSPPDQWAAQMLKSATHFIIPEENTISWLEIHASSIYINTRSRELRQALLGSSRLHAISSPVAFSPHDQVMVYRRGAVRPPNQ
jgi:hypothetical protein